MNFPSMMVFLALSGAGQTIATYRVQNRLAAEMVSVAEAALGGDGSVVLDARTATLILNGSAGAVRRALALLEELDRPLRVVAVTHELRDASELEAWALDISWRATIGAFRVGTLPAPADGLRVALSAGRESHSSRARSVLRLLEGGSGLIVTGESLPFVYMPYWGPRSVSFVPAETGFETSASIHGEGPDLKIRLDIRPFSGRLEGHGGLRYTAASTSLTVSPGETIVIGEVSREGSGESLDLAGGSGARLREEQVLTVSVEIENP